MRGRGLIGIATVLATVAAAALVPAAGLAAAGPLHGRYYDGKNSSAGGTSLALDFQVSGNGRQI